MDPLDYDLEGLQFDGKDHERLESLKDKGEKPMAKEWIDASAAGDTWDKKDPIQGLYVAKKINVGSHNSNMYMIKVDGEQVGVWGSAVLDGRFEEIPVGSEVRIEHLGEVTGRNGTKYVDYKVQYRPADDAIVDASEVGELDGII